MTEETKRIPRRPSLKINAISNWADLAGANILSKFHRYEGHIDRILYRALHELQRLQAKRTGQQIDAPHVLDVDI